MTDDATWAVVEVHKGTQEIFSYRGLIDREDLQAWREGTLQGALTIRSLYWLEIDQGKVVPHVVGRRGEFRNATGVVHVAASSVLVIMELSAPEPGVLDEEEGGAVLRLATRSSPPPVPTGRKVRTLHPVVRPEPEREADEETEIGDPEREETEVGDPERGDPEAPEPEDAEPEIDDTDASEPEDAEPDRSDS